MPEAYIIICIFVLITGACIGSFLNVVALRKMSGESIVFPSSKCPLCQTPIKWYDNIPVLSYFLTVKGKCRSCGGKISIQYPITEAFTALMFLGVFLGFGISVKTLLLLILLCISTVIVITDIKEKSVYDSHSISLIIISVIYGLYAYGLNQYSLVLTGLIAGAVIMEITARVSYYFIKKKSEKPEENTEEKDNVPSDKTEGPKENAGEDINKYVEKNKRAFGEGDTYLAAASGALLGWKLFIVALFIAIIIQTLLILPQFFKKLYADKQIKLLISSSSFFILATVYFMISNIFNLNAIMTSIMIILLIYFAADTIINLKKTTLEGGYKAIPFGPALLTSTFIVLFFGYYILIFLIKYIFMFS